jgi:vacuolar-type H+-ATPase subunit F/Vma7
LYRILLEKERVKVYQTAPKVKKKIDRARNEKKPLFLGIPKQSERIKRARIRGRRAK